MLLNTNWKRLDLRRFTGGGQFDFAVPVLVVLYTLVQNVWLGFHLSLFEFLFPQQH